MGVLNSHEKSNTENEAYEELEEEEKEHWKSILEAKRKWEEKQKRRAERKESEKKKSELELTPSGKEKKHEKSSQNEKKKEEKVAKEEKRLKEDKHPKEETLQKEKDTTGQLVQEERFLNENASNDEKFYKENSSSPKKNLSSLKPMETKIATAEGNESKLEKICVEKDSNQPIDGDIEFDMNAAEKNQTSEDKPATEQGSDKQLCSEKSDIDSKVGEVAHITEVEGNENMPEKLSNEGYSNQHLMGNENTAEELPIEKADEKEGNSKDKTAKEQIHDKQNCPGKSNVESMFDGISTETEPKEETTVKDTAVLETPKEDTSLFDGKNSIENGEQNEKRSLDSEKSE